MRALRTLFVLGSIPTAWLLIGGRHGPAPSNAQSGKPVEAVPAAAAPAQPFGIERRIPWTTSKVVGAPTPPPPYRVKRAFPRLTFHQPIHLIREPGTDNLLITEHQGSYEGQGKVFRIEDRRDTDRIVPFLHVNRVIYGIAFHPNYLKNGYLYTGSNGPDYSKRKATRVSRFTVDRQAPFHCDPKSEQVILEWDSDGHNGGDLAFGPDGFLYVSSGDGTSDSDTNLRGQDLGKLTAKVLRLDVDHPDGKQPYSVPKDNPFVNRPGVRPETWAYGFRNPWRLTYDHQTNQLWVGNNGQDLWEQAFLVRRGENYGWSVWEGSHPFQPKRKAGPDPIVKPTVEHPHSEARSLTGGLVYHGKRFPELSGAYIYGDYSTGKIWGVRHDGTKILWHKELASTRLQITHFGADTHGEVLIVDHLGGLYEFELTPADRPKTQFPTRLSATGLFVSVKDYRPEPALIPYTVNAPLWSDGAVKERHIALPGTEQIDFSTGRGWNCPDGTVLVKTFSLPTETNAGLRRIETRLLTRQEGEWVGYSYRWNQDQTDAELVDGAGTDRTYEVRAPGGSRKQTWHFPSRVECMVCHSRAANYVLGLTAVQMNKVHDYGKVADNQLRALEHIGVFRVNWLEHTRQTRQTAKGIVRWPVDLVWDGAVQPALTHSPLSPPLQDALAQAGKGLRDTVQRGWNKVPDPLAWVEKELRKKPRYTTWLPKRPDEYRRLADPLDRRQDLNARARAYLHANCSQCHVAAGGGNAAIELEFNTPDSETRLFDVQPLHHTYDIADARLIVPGHPERSILLQRLARRGPGQMPPLASSEIDEEAVKLIRKWIVEYRPKPGKAKR